MITKSEKIDLIKKIALENDISAYQIGTDTEVSISSATKIFSGEQKNPRNKTLNIILEYLENAIVGTKAKYELKEEYKSVAETNLNYDVDFASLKIDDKLNIINEKLDLLLSKK